jgi:hypothetical protein
MKGHVLAVFTTGLLLVSIRTAAQSADTDSSSKIKTTQTKDGGAVQKFDLTPAEYNSFDKSAVEKVRPGAKVSINKHGDGGATVTITMTKKQFDARKAQYQGKESALGSGCCCRCIAGGNNGQTFHDANNLLGICLGTDVWCAVWKCGAPCQVHPGDCP